MQGIPIYRPDETDFSTNGLGLLTPTECTVEEIAGGMYELTLKHPIGDTLRWAQIQNGCIVKARVPVRETPFYEETVGGSTTVVREIYRVRVNTRLRLRRSPNTSSKILGRYKNGTEVIKLENAGTSNGHTWYRVALRNGGATGYMAATYLQYSTSITQTVQNGAKDQRIVQHAQSRDQIFRVCSVEHDTQNGMVTLKATHIFYDLNGNLVNGEYEPQKTAASSVVSYITARLLNGHDFTFHANGLSKKIAGDYGYKSIVECLLNPDEGVVSQSGARLIRDFYDVWMLPDETRDTGVTIRRRKNLKGVVVNHDTSNIVTRIIPVGKNKKGDPLYLSGTKYVDSSRINDYPCIYAQRIEYDVKSGSEEFETDTAARTELRRLAQLEYSENKVDLADYSIEVDFITLQGTAEGAEEFPNYAGLQSVYLYDTVTVIDELIGLTAKLRVTGYKWDALAEAYISVTLGEIQDLSSTVYGYNIQNGSVSGSKITPNSIGGMALRNLSIEYAKITQAAIEQLSADALTAVSAYIHKLTTGEIEADQLYTDLAKIGLAEIDTANIDWASIATLNAAIAEISKAHIKDADIDWADIASLDATIAQIAQAKIEDATIDTAQIDNLSAVIAQVLHAQVETGEFTFAEIENLLSNAMILRQGQMESVQIVNLAVTSANLLNATVGNLVIQGDDGGYYRVFIGSDGTVRTEEVTLTDGEIAAGQTSAGQQIVSSSANIADLNATNLQASSAAIASILTESLTAGKITAGEALIASATIPALYVTSLNAIGGSIDLSANESISMMVGGLENDVSAAQSTADAARADAAENAQVLQTLRLAVDGLDYVESQTFETLAGRVETLESGVHISGAEIGLYASGSPYRNTITNTGWVVSENGAPVIACAETRLTAPRVYTTDALILGRLAWKVGRDRHTRLLKYGR